MSFKIVTADALAGKKIEEIDEVSVHAVIGINIVRDIFGVVRDFVGGRSGAFEAAVNETKAELRRELEAKAREAGADAVVAARYSFSPMGKDGSLLLVDITGTAVRIVG
jgi:uncharacterized protein YbjQ (UPF0145 family)